MKRFVRELFDHLRQGYVFALPRTFLMAKAIQLPDGRYAWFITHAHGDLRALAALMPFPLEWICFRRRLDPQLRIYPMARFQELAGKKK